MDRRRGTALSLPPPPPPSTDALLLVSVEVFNVLRERSLLSLSHIKTNNKLVRKIYKIKKECRRKKAKMYTAG